MLTLKDIDGRRMKVVAADPPNIAAIVAVFPIVRERFKRGILFCYGDTIYNPADRPLPPQLAAHEAVHGVQQEIYGDVENWWFNYLASPTFRFNRELEAHRVEYEKYTVDGWSRADRRRYLAACAERLSGPLYGGVCKKNEAKRLIKGDDDGD